RQEAQGHADLWGPFPLILRPGLHPTLEKRSVVDCQVHREAASRRGKYPQEQPASPVIERAGRPEDEDDKKEGPEHSLNNRLPVERIHIKTSPGRLWQQSGTLARHGEPAPARCSIPRDSSRRPLGCLRQGLYGGHVCDSLASSPSRSWRCPSL